MIEFDSTNVHRDPFDVERHRVEHLNMVLHPRSWDQPVPNLWTSLHTEMPALKSVTLKLSLHPFTPIPPTEGFDFRGPSILLRRLSRGIRQLTIYCLDGVSRARLVTKHLIEAIPLLVGLEVFKMDFNSAPAPGRDELSTSIHAIATAICIHTPVRHMIFWGMPVLLQVPRSDSLRCLEIRKSHVNAETLRLAVLASVEDLDLNECSVIAENDFGIAVLGKALNSAPHLRNLSFSFGVGVTTDTYNMFRFFCVKLSEFQGASQLSSISVRDRSEHDVASRNEAYMSLLHQVARFSKVTTLDLDLCPFEASPELFRDFARHTYGREYEKLQLRVDGTLSATNCIEMADLLKSSPVKAFALHVEGKIEDWETIVKAAATNSVNYVSSFKLTGRLSEYSKTMKLAMKYVESNTSIRCFNVEGLPPTGTCCFSNNPEEYDDETAAEILESIQHNFALEELHIGLEPHQEQVECVFQMNRLGRAYMTKNNTIEEGLEFLGKLNDLGNESDDASVHTKVLYCLFFHLRENVSLFFGTERPSKSEIRSPLGQRKMERSKLEMEIAELEHLLQS